MYITKVRWLVSLFNLCWQPFFLNTKPIRYWIDGKVWKNHYPNYNDLLSLNQKEINKAFNQESAGIMMSVWEEVSLIFIRFLKNSPYSPYKKVGAFFAQKEYQSNSGNVYHTHTMIEVYWALITI